MLYVLVVSIGAGMIYMRAHMAMDHEAIASAALSIYQS